jgi:hypothetical protein
MLATAFESLSVAPNVVVLGDHPLACVDSLRDDVGGNAFVQLPADRSRPPCMWRMRARALARELGVRYVTLVEVSIVRTLRSLTWPRKPAQVVSDLTGGHAAF